MWDTLGSPPENFRFYKFTDHSGEKEGMVQNIDLEENRKNLFQNESLSSVPEESVSRTNAEILSQNTQKPVSSLKSTSKVNSKVDRDKSNYDLKMNLKHMNAKPQSKSLLEHINKQKSTLLLSHKQKSSVIKEESYRKASKNEQRSHQESKSQQFLNSQKQSFLNNINNQEEDQFSQIFIKEINKTEEHIKNGNMFRGDKQKGDIYLQTLMEIREIQRQQLLLQKKMWKMTEERGQISFLYDKEDKSQQKFFRNKKENRKSFKRTQEKSTIKKLGKSLAFEQRIAKVQQKCRDLQKRLECQNSRKTPTMSRIKKKSMSALR